MILENDVVTVQVQQVKNDKIITNPKPDRTIQTPKPDRTIQQPTPDRTVQPKPSSNE